MGFLVFILGFLTTHVFGKTILIGGADLGVMYGKASVVSTATVIPSGGGAPAPTTQPYTLKSSGAAIGPHLGIETDFGDFFGGLELSGTVDTARANAKVDNETHRFQRNYSLKFLARLGWHIAPCYDIYMNGGGLYTNTGYFYADDDGFNGNKVVNLSGWSAGIGMRYALTPRMYFGFRYAYESLQKFDAAVLQNVKNGSGGEVTYKPVFKQNYQTATLSLSYKL